MDLTKRVEEENNLSNDMSMALGANKQYYGHDVCSECKTWYPKINIRQKTCNTRCSIDRQLRRKRERLALKSNANPKE